MILQSIQKAFASLLRPKVLLVVLLPTIITLIIWIFLLVIFWKAIIGYAELQLVDSFLVTLPHSLLSLVFNIDPMSIASFLAVVLVIFASIPMTYLFNLLLVSTLLMPLFLPLIASEDYPNLEKKFGGSLVGGIVNSFWSSILFGVLLTISLPFWLIPGVPLLVPLVLSSYLNQRVFLYDVWQDYASAEERHLLKQNKSQSFAMGMLTAFLNYIPVINFLSATLTALCFIHFGLGSLENMRRIQDKK